MKRNTLLVLLLIETTVIILGLIQSCTGNSKDEKEESSDYISYIYENNLEERSIENELFRELSPDGNYTLSITEVIPPDFPFGKDHLKITLFETISENERQRVCYSASFTADVANDGARAGYEVEWLEDGVQIALSGSEQPTAYYVLPFKTLDEATDKAEDDQEPKTKSSLDDTAVSEGGKTYSIEEYGTVEEKRQEYFADGTENMSFYYKMENFFFSDTLSNAEQVNHTLQQIYDGYEESYIEGAKVHKSEVDEALETPYTYWRILSLKYVGEDYVSILYNDVYYMGGAHPYSRFDGITIDCKTGQQVSASQLLEKSDKEILTEISNAMGIASIDAWDDVDFYLTDSTIVFFYRMPGFWEDVILQREK